MNNNFIVTTVPGLPHGQEKSGKTKKNDKSQVKMRVFEKSQKKTSDFVSSKIQQKTCCFNLL